MTKKKQESTLRKKQKRSWKQQLAKADIEVRRKNKENLRIRKLKKVK